MTISLRPIHRSSFRIYIGKKVYRLKRYYDWFFGGIQYARTKKASLLPYVVFTHQTPLLRRLKDVDMWLQHNKVKNLKIASERLNRLVIKPGETFSYWR